MTTLRCEHLSYAVDNKTLLDDVTVSFAPGKLIGIIGPNGAGKTTWLRLLAGLLPPTRGSVSIGSTPLQSLPIQQRARQVSWLSSRETPAFAFTVKDVVVMGRFPHHGGLPGSQDFQIARQCLLDLGVKDLEERLVTSLSDGELQKVRIARTLATEAPIILCDEPLTALDPAASLACLRTLKAKAAQGALVCVSLHDLNLGLQCFDELVCLQAGRIVQQGKPDVVLTSKLLADVFHADARVEATASGTNALIFDL